MSVYDEPGIEGQFKVWYIPQVPMQAFTREAPDLPAAKLLLNTIIDFSIFEFENKVKPDYSDAAGILRFEDGAWNDVDEEEWRDDL